MTTVKATRFHKGEPAPAPTLDELLAQDAASRAATGPAATAEPRAAPPTRPAQTASADTPQASAPAATERAAQTRVRLSPNAAEVGLSVDVAPQAAARAPAPTPSAPQNRAQPAAPPPAATDDGDLFNTYDDGFGEMAFATATRAPQTAATTPPASAEAQIEAIRQEGLTGRQLRNATRLALRHNLKPRSDFDAVRLLREAGIDPFQRRSMLDLTRPDPPQTAPSAEAMSALPRGDALKPLPGDGVRLPKTVQPIEAPTPQDRIEVNHAHEIQRMQQEIAQRRRQRLALLFTRLFIFVFLPTLLAGWYFNTMATQQYGTKSEFAVQMAEAPSAAASGMGGLLQGTSMATAQDSIAVQGYLESREAMLRLESDLGFRRNFMGPEIDPLLRLPPDATLEAAYKIYRSHVVISYDPTEGIIRMEVIAPTPELSVAWSNQLIDYAEEQVDQLTARLREDAMRGSRESYLEAEAAVISSQERMIALQEQFKILSSESEAALLLQHIGSLETQILTDRLSITQMEANPAPNLARMEPIKRRIQSMEDELQVLRRRMTEGENGSSSLAQVQGQMLVAQADVETRQMILAQSLQAMENSRIEANRQTRYLSTSVKPIPPDVATYPRVFENTAVALLILLGIYLMVSMTVSILREQVSS